MSHLFTREGETIGIGTKEVAMQDLKNILVYFKKHNLILTTAESCTAGKIVSLLAEIPGSGECLDAGYVVYSVDAKKRLLKVQQKTIDQYTLTSEQVAEEMARGALEDSKANVVVATTGLAGDEPKDGIPPGTICFAWGFQSGKRINIYTETQHFEGSRSQVQNLAACYVLKSIPLYHQKYTLSGL